MIVAPVEPGAKPTSLQHLFSFEDVDVEHLHTDLAELRSLKPQHLLTTLRSENKILRGGMDAPQTLLDVRVSREEMKKGIDAEEFRSLFKQHATRLAGVRLLSDDQ
jgi:hypothetical protein